MATTLWHHEMWMDELNPWLIARDAHGLRSLFLNMHGESHPPLWYLLLYAVSRLSIDPRAMQALHLLIATGTILLIATVSPFSRLERWLVAFSYLFVYEFAVISRGYAGGVLLALAACAVYATARPRVLLLALLLAALAQTSAYGILLALTIVAGIVFDRRIAPTGKTIAALGGVLAACVLAGLFVLPAPDVLFGREWHVPWTLSRVEYMLNAAWAAYMPLPDVHSHTPWNSNLVFGNWQPSGRAPSPLGALLGLTVLVACAYGVRRRRSALVMYLTGTVLMLALIGLKYSGGMRHHGHLLILLIVVLWMMRGQRASSAMPMTRPALAALLVPQVIAGLFFVVQDLREPFSVSKEVAALVDTLPKTTPVVVVASQPINDAAPELSGYLRHPVNLALRHQVVRASFATFDAERYDVGTARDLLKVLDQFAADRGGNVVVVTENWESTQLGTLLACFDQHLARDEGSIAVYRLQTPPAGPPAPGR